MRLTVDKCQCAAPRSAKDQPLFNTKMVPQLFDVRDEQSSGIVLYFTQRSGTSGTTLVENNNPVMCRIKKTAMTGRGTSTGPSMEEQNRNTFRVTRLFPVHGVNAIQWQCAVIIGFNRGEKLGVCHSE